MSANAIKDLVNGENRSQGRYLKDVQKEMQAMLQRQVEIDEKREMRDQEKAESIQQLVLQMKGLLDRIEAREKVTMGEAILKELVAGEKKEEILEAPPSTTTKPVKASILANTKKLASNMGLAIKTGAINTSEATKKGYSVTKKFLINAFHYVAKRIRAVLGWTALLLVLLGGGYLLIDNFGIVPTIIIAKVIAITWVAAKEWVNGIGEEVTSPCI